MKKLLATIILAISLQNLSYASPLTSELTCLAYNIYFEARNQLTQHQFAVAFVTINRKNSKLFPDTICGVIKQRLQFSWYWDGKSDKPQESSALATAFKVAKLALSGNFTDNTGGALWYHNQTVNPHWASNLEKVGTFGDHTFYRQKFSVESPS